MRYKVVPEQITGEGEVFLRLSYREFDLLSTVLSGSTSNVGCSNFWSAFKQAAAQRWEVPAQRFHEPNFGSAVIRRYVLERRGWAVEPTDSLGLRVALRPSRHEHEEGA